MALVFWGVLIVRLRIERLRPVARIGREHFKKHRVAYDCHFLLLIQLFFAKIVINVLVDVLSSTVDPHFHIWHKLHFGFRERIVDHFRHDFGIILRL